MFVCFPVGVGMNDGWTSYPPAENLMADPCDIENTQREMVLPCKLGCTDYLHTVYMYIYIYIEIHKYIEYINTIQI